MHVSARVCDAGALVWRFIYRISFISNQYDVHVNIIRSDLHIIEGYVFMRYVLHNMLAAYVFDIRANSNSRTKYIITNNTTLH